MMKGSSCIMHYFFVCLGATRATRDDRTVGGNWSKGEKKAVCMRIRMHRFIPLYWSEMFTNYIGKYTKQSLLPN